MFGRFARTVGVFSLGALSAVGAIGHVARKRRAEQQAERTPVAIIRLNGIIAPSEQAGGIGSSRFINDQRFEEAFESAFQLHGVKAVALIINSPGGSPTQSSMMYKHLLDLRRRYPRVPLLAFVEDSCASGGYYVACAASEIIANENSVVGSIGVIRSSFGFSDLIKTYGIERRVQTAGASKNKMDPFFPETAKDRAFVDVLLNTLHANFIDAVKAGRGCRLQPQVAAELALQLDPEQEKTDGLGLFDGSVYIGQAAKDVGLIDGFGECKPFLRDRFRPSEFVEIRPKTDLIKEILSQLGL